MENIKILKISLVFFAFMFLMKNINDYDKKNENKKPNKTSKNIEKFALMAIKPWEDTFSYKGKSDKKFDITADQKLIGSVDDYKQASTGAPNFNTDFQTFCETTALNSGGVEGYLYLDERYTYNDLPYNSHYTIGAATNYPNSSTTKSDINHEKEYIPILLPVVGKVDSTCVDTPTNKCDLELKEPQVVKLSYKDKKITTRDTSANCNYKSMTGVETSDYTTYREDCNDHQGYCSFVSCNPGTNLCI